MRIFLVFLIVGLIGTSAVDAQSNRAWIQIAARPTLAQALETLRAQSQRLEGLRGYRMRSGWYAISLGPFAPGTAVLELDRLVAQQRIPSDSFIARRNDYRRQFWPIGRSGLSANAPLAARQPGPMANPSFDSGEVEETIIAEASEPEDIGALEDLDDQIVPDETVSQARRSERGLTRTEREELQRALAWAGTYSAAIDGDFGPGTRRAMEGWQALKGYDATGILTTRQRAEAMATYRTELNALQLAPLEDDSAGIRVPIPSGLVSYASTDPPFVHYEGAGADPARVILISQIGDTSRLAALFRVIQSLDVIPPEARTRLNRTSFTIEGANEGFSTYMEAQIYGDAIKGFGLVWPTTAPGRAAQIAAVMRDGFEPIEDQILSDSIGDSQNQSVDLFAGLSLRRAEYVQSGVYIDGEGSVLTTAGDLSACARITLDGDEPADMKSVPGALGLAVLTPRAAAAPIDWASFRNEPGRLSTEIAVGGYPYSGRLGAPSVNFGQLADIRGLNGEETLDRLKLTSTRGDLGGPVLDVSGAVIGVLSPEPAGLPSELPSDVSFSTDSVAIIDALKAAGYPVSTSLTSDARTPEEIVSHASDITAMVSCW